MSTLPEGRIDSKELAEHHSAAIREEAALLSHTARAPSLATVLVGDDPGSSMYVAMKQREADALGIEAKDVRLPADISQSQLTETLAHLSSSALVDAILLQYPLPPQLNYLAALAAIDPRKDADGLHPVNLGALAAGEPKVLPCTPQGIVELLEHWDIALSGRRITVVGRGLTVGRPFSILASLRTVNATVTVVHTGTRQADIEAAIKGAEVVVGAAGTPSLIQPEWIAENAILVAAGVAFPEGKAISDFAPGCRERALAWTPTVGGIGPMTRVLLFRNVLSCRRLVADGS